MLLRQISGDTPITVNQSAGSPCASLKRRPIGSASGQNFFAIVSLMTATVVRLMPSASVKSRPLTSGTAIVFCKWGVVPARKMKGSSPGSTLSRR